MVQQARPSLSRRSRSSFRQRVAIPHRGVSSDGPKTASYTVLDTLDIAIPLPYQMGKWHAQLDTSLLQAMQQLAAVREELLSEESDSTSSSETETLDDGEDEDEEKEDLIEVRAAMESLLPAKPSRRRKGGAARSQDLELLENFLQEAYELLKSIRDDIESHLPALPSRQDLVERFPNASATALAAANAADPRIVLERLSYNWHRAQQIFAHLSVLSMPFSLPEMPEAISSISTSARASLANQKRRFTMSFSPTPSSVTTPTSEKAHPFSPSSLHLPTPPISAVRAFLREESARLQSKLPTPPSLEEWKEGLSNALHDVKDFVEEEAERLRNALQNGATRLLHYSELPTEWRNNKYILSGYRFVPIDRPVELIWGGLTTIHNETFNSTHYTRTTTLRLLIRPTQSTRTSYPPSISSTISLSCFPLPHWVMPRQTLSLTASQTSPSLLHPLHVCFYLLRGT